MIVLGVACAGAIGAVARYVVDIVVSDRARTNLPVGTLVINVSGSFVLGVLTGLALYHGFASTPKIVVGTGFCGGFTTYSAFTVQAHRRGRTNGAAYAVATVVVALAACAVGVAVGQA